MYDTNSNQAGTRATGATSGCHDETQPGAWTRRQVGKTTEQPVQRDIAGNARRAGTEARSAGRRAALHLAPITWRATRPPCCARRRRTALRGQLISAPLTASTAAGLSHLVRRPVSSSGRGDGIDHGPRVMILRACTEHAGSEPGMTGGGGPRGLGLHARHHLSCPAVGLRRSQLPQGPLGAGPDRLHLPGPVDHRGDSAQPVRTPLIRVNRPMPMIKPAVMRPSTVTGV
jgi:hypothetical protein